MCREAVQKALPFVMNVNFHLLVKAPRKTKMSRLTAADQPSLCIEARQIAAITVLGSF